MHILNYLRNYNYISSVTTDNNRKLDFVYIIDKLKPCLYSISVVKIVLIYIFNQNHIYSETCVNQTLNKTESCLTRIVNKIKAQCSKSLLI